MNKMKYCSVSGKKQEHDWVEEIGFERTNKPGTGLWKCVKCFTYYDLARPGQFLDMEGCFHIPFENKLVNEIVEGDYAQEIEEKITQIFFNNEFTDAHVWEKVATIEMRVGDVLKEVTVKRFEPVPSGIKVDGYTTKRGYFYYKDDVFIYSFDGYVEHSEKIPPEILRFIPIKTKELTT